MAISSIAKVLNWTATIKPMANTLEKGFRNPAPYAARMFLFSIVSKDLINTILYTYQSLKNDEIPKEKRSFVAANDLILGFFNFFGQIGSYMLFDKYFTPWLASKFYTGMKEDKKTGEYTLSHTNAPACRDNLRVYAHKIIKEKGAELATKDSKLNEIMKSDELRGVLIEDLIKQFDYKSSKGKALATGVGVVVTALATTALIKRTVSTIFSTPIAGKISDWANKRDKDKQEDKSEKTIEITPAIWSYNSMGNIKCKNQSKFNKTA